MEQSLALVTGDNTGIGLAAIERLSAAGFAIAFLGRGVSAALTVTSTYMETQV